MAEDRDRERREGWEGRLRRLWHGRGRDEWDEGRGEWDREYWPRERWGDERERWGGEEREGWGGREGWSEARYRGEPYRPEPYRSRGEWGGEGRWGREGYYGGYPGGMSYYGGAYGGGYAGGYGYNRPPRGRYAGRGPRNYQRPDDLIRDDAIEQLTRHPDIDATEVDVQVSGGVVALAGTVENREMKHMAEDTVEGVFGVKEVRNELRLQPTMAGQRTEIR